MMEAFFVNDGFIFFGFSGRVVVVGSGKNALRMGMGWGGVGGWVGGWVGGGGSGGGTIMSEVANRVGEQNWRSLWLPPVRRTLRGALFWHFDILAFWHCGVAACCAL